VAGALGYALSVKNLHVMNVEFYTGSAPRLRCRSCSACAERGRLSAKKVLIADDVADTGRTIELVHDSSPATWRGPYRVIYEKSQSLIKCDTCGGAPTSGSTSVSSQPPVVGSSLDA